MSRGVRQLVFGCVAVAAAGLTVAVLGSTQADAAPVTSEPATSATCTGNIQVFNADGASLGYVGNYTVLSGEYAITTDAAKYLQVSFTQGTQQDITTLNGEAAPNNHLDLQQSDLGGSTFATGSLAYAWLLGGSLTPAGSPASGTGTSTFGGGVSSANPIESAVWDTSSLNSLTPTWINPDGQPGPTQLFFDSQLQFLGAASDLAAYNSHFGEDAIPVTFSFVGTCTSPCTTTITTPHPALVLTSGITCVIGTTIKGGITVVDGASLDLENAKVTGSISAQGLGSLRECGSTTGGITVTAATGPVVIGDPANGCAGNVIKGGLTATGNTGGGTISGNTITGSWLITKNTPAFAVTGNHH